MKNWIKLSLLTIIIMTLVGCTKKDQIQPVSKKQVVTNDEVRMAFEQVFRSGD